MFLFFKKFKKRQRPDQLDEVNTMLTTGFEPIFLPLVEYQGVEPCWYLQCKWSDHPKQSHTP